MGAITLLDRTAFHDDRGESGGTTAARGLPPAGGGVGCEVWHLCLTAGLDDFSTRAVEQMVSSRTRLAKGQALYRPGEEFRALYAIRSGSCKSVMVTEEGREQVMGYHMRGEFIGTDGLATHIHASQAARSKIPRFARFRLIAWRRWRVAMLDSSTLCTCCWLRRWHVNERSY